MKNGNKYTIGSLFSGIGGIELGFERAGFRTLWCVEDNTYAQSILKQQFPDATIYGDITGIDWMAVRKVDILTGGFPCQDISNAGKGAGIEGSRSSLWKDYLKAIRVLRPKIAFIENVSALTYRGLDIVLADLASVGYDAEWHCVPASAVGAPHQRDRLFIISYPNCNGCGRLGQKFKGRCNPEQINIIESKGSTITHPYSIMLQRELTSKFNEERWSKQNKRQIRSLCNGIGWWATEPRLGRVAHGVPNRVYRIKCLGNAVVPQLAEVFARAIKIMISRV